MWRGSLDIAPFRSLGPAIAAPLFALLIVAGCAENTPPKFVEVTVLSDTSGFMGPYEVMATVHDDRAVDKVSLFYDINDGEVLEVPMENIQGDVWRAELEGQPTGSVIRYLILALDEEGEQSQFPPEDADPELAVFRVLPGE